MNSNTSTLLNILEAENKIQPDRLEEFRRISRAYKTQRSLAFLGTSVLGSIFAFQLVKEVKSSARKTPVKIAGPLLGIATASYYLGTSLDYFVSQNYFGKIMATVKMDEDIYRLIKEEFKLDYEVLNKFCFR